MFEGAAGGSGDEKSSIQSNGSLKVVDRVVMPDVTLKSETLKSSSKPLQIIYTILLLSKSAEKLKLFTSQLVTSLPSCLAKK